MTRTALLALLALLASGPAAALLTRADRDDAEYLELATRYPATARLDAPEGAGILIAPRWVLTAAHVVAPLKDRPGQLRISLAGRPAPVQAIYVHPDWRPGRGPDLALLHLRIPVEGIEPVPTFRGPDEPGLAVRVVGHGAGGRIGEKPSKPADRKPRAAVNTVDRVSPALLGLRIKSPDDASDLQGVLDEGDRGGPAIVEIDGKFFVAGIGFATEDANGDGIAGNAGDWDLFVRVSAFAAWIDGVAAYAAAEEAASLLGEANQR